MSSAYGAAGGTQAAVLSTIGQAIKASGSIIQVEKDEFEKVLAVTDQKLVAACPAKGLFGRNQYMVPYKGFVFYLKHRDLVRIPEGFEVITAKRIWNPY